MPLPKDIVKIAVQMPGAYPQLIDLDQKKPLSTVLKEVCDVWNKSNPDQYALQYADGIQTYITETNRHDIKNGSILRLATAPFWLGLCLQLSVRLGEVPGNSSEQDCVTSGHRFNINTKHNREGVRRDSVERDVRG
ncbi:hypothetical protein chiPu_0021364 [Chiloscyllium punctatum]|uniref:Uncharacterized protein n=1 Tax=Chiloscyllium punctatum TaxID=137246 RepID=A0A401RE50_CHIPU|nr:hypothetical protein [Chiloscyllium punctatum]